ncbi:hypothetical protein [Aliiroseovarius sp. PrR006]|uniref:hypothetical protein n=1 Tax=Aliiroseovarius sp. PrR006 TaxID=2706883 RepID=UPI0013D2D76F|nr:hypothetical protein [Aliiroseovarius sp. PrR006]NDW54617.1 hypothetical protein [Aliiroseovarius sp. PrR006]
MIARDTYPETEARGPSYELTDIGMPNTPPSNPYLKWRPGNDFEITRHHSSAHSGEGSLFVLRIEIELRKPQWMGDNGPFLSFATIAVKTGFNIV